MKYAKKGNRVYPIETEHDEEIYLNRGFDIQEVGEDGSAEVIRHSPVTKIAYAEHERLMSGAVNRIEEITKMNQKLQKEIADLKKTDKGAKADIKEAEAEEKPSEK